MDSNLSFSFKIALFAFTNTNTKNNKIQTQKIKYWPNMRRDNNICSNPPFFCFAASILNDLIKPKLRQPNRAKIKHHELLTSKTTKRLPTPPHPPPPSTQTSSSKVSLARVTLLPLLASPGFNSFEVGTSLQHSQQFYFM